MIAQRKRCDEVHLLERRVLLHVLHGVRQRRLSIAQSEAAAMGLMKFIGYMVLSMYLSVTGRELVSTCARVIVTMRVSWIP